MRSTVATANRSLLAAENESIAASVSEVSNPDAKVEYFLDFKSSRAAFAKPPVFEDRVLPMRWSSRSTMSSVAIRIGPLMRSRSSSSMSLLCSSIWIRKLVSRRTVRGRCIFAESLDKPFDFVRGSDLMIVLPPEPETPNLSPIME